LRQRLKIINEIDPADLLLLASKRKTSEKPAKNQREKLIEYNYLLIISMR